MTDKDELFKGIDEAANNLFEQYIVKKPESTPAAVPEPELELEGQETPLPETATEPEPEAEIEATQEPEFSADAEDLYGKLEEALLTIDWEVNNENILNTREVLGKLVQAKGWTSSSLVGQVTDHMEKVLDLMLESPENSPISAPSQLKNSLEALKNSETPSEESDRKLKSILADLRDLLPSPTSTEQATGYELQTASPVESISPAIEEEPSFDLGLGLEMSEDSAIESQEPPPGEQVPQETTDVLKRYTDGIAEAVKLLTPMENLFASRPTMAKLHGATQKIKEKLVEQEKLFKETFSSDFSLYNGLGTLNSWLESQLEVVRKSAVRIGKMEKLFGKTAGYEKLHIRSRKIRKGLENQLDALTVAVGGAPTQHQFDLTGEYPAVIQPTPAKEPEAPAAAVSAVVSPEEMVDKCINLAKSLEDGSSDDLPQKAGMQIRKQLEKLKTALTGAAIRSPGATAAASAAVAMAGHATKCRWDWLLKTSWGGQLVGIAPEQVAYESKSTFPLSTFKDLTFFNLKKLKSVPWKKLNSLFSGELAELDNSVLNDMELEIAKPPASFPGSSKKKVYLVILYSGGRGKVFLVDAPTEAISVAEEALWSPGTSTESDNIAGTLTVYGSTIPVVSID